MKATTKGVPQTMTEEIVVAGSDLLDRVKGLLNEGRVRHIKVKSAAGETYFEVPLAVGLLGGAALAWASPFVAMAGALAGLVSSVKLEVVREGEGGDNAVAGGMNGGDMTKSAVVTATRRAPRAADRAKTGAKRTVATAKKVISRAPTVTAKREGGAARKAAARAKPKTTGRR